MSTTHAPPRHSGVASAAIPVLGTHEFALNARGVRAHFFSTLPESIVDIVEQLEELPDPRSSGPLAKKGDYSNLTYEKRLEGSEPVWSLRLDHRGDLAAAFSFVQSRNELPEVDIRTDIVLTKTALAREYIGSSAWFEAKLEHILLPDYMMVQGKAMSSFLLDVDAPWLKGSCEFDATLKRHGAHTVWTIARTDSERLENVLRLRPRDEARPGPREFRGLQEIRDDEFALTAHGIQKWYWSADYQATCQHIAQQVALPNPRYFSGTTYSARVTGGVSNFLFIRRANERGEPTWVLPAWDRERFGTACGLFPGPSWRDIRAFDPKTEIALTQDGLRAHFVGSASSLQLKLQEGCESSDPLSDRTRMQRSIRIKHPVTGEVETFPIEQRRSGRHLISVLSVFKKSDFARQLNLTSRSPTIPSALDTASDMDAVALLGGDPVQLYKFLKHAHPEMAPDEIESFTLNLLKGMEQTDEDPYAGFDLAGDPPELSTPTELEFDTEERSFIIEGRAAAGCDRIAVSGSYRREIEVRADRTFRAAIPIPRAGKVSTFFISGVDTTGETISRPEIITVNQTSEVEDIAVAFRRLLQYRDEMLADILTNQSRREALRESVSLSLLIEFTEDPEAGFKYLEKLIRKTTNPMYKRLYEGIYQEFAEIAANDFGVGGERTPYFFQKWTTHRAQEARRLGEDGIIIANEQGTGKTLVGHMIAHGEPVTIISPKAVVSNWVREEQDSFDVQRLRVLEGTFAERDAELAAARKASHVVQVEYIRGMPEARRQLLSRKGGMIIVDEADILGSKRSLQAIGIRSLTADFFTLLAATPFSRFGQIGNVLAQVDKAMAELFRKGSFSKVFNPHTVEGSRAIHAALMAHTVRIRKEDVFRFYDPSKPLRDQNNRLPRKVNVSPESMGQFKLHPIQCRAALELFTDYPAWCVKHRMSGAVTSEDKSYYRFKDGFFARREALRQIMNDPAYIGRPDIESPKHLKMDDIIQHEMKKGARKGLIFCRYREQVNEYYQRYHKKYGVSRVFGELRQDSNGNVVNDRGDRIHFAVDDRGRFAKDRRTGLPIPTKNSTSLPMKALDYEVSVFQNSPDCRLIVATYDCGSVGLTMTAADFVVFDDLARTYRDEYQAADRAHRIDNDRKKYDVTYYWLQALYPDSFVAKLPKGEQPLFKVGTYDQINFQNLRHQGRIFHRILDGLGDDRELLSVQAKLHSKMPFLFDKHDIRAEQIEILRGYQDRAHED